MNFKFLLAVFVVAVALMPTAHSNRGRKTPSRLKELKERLAAKCRRGTCPKTKTSTGVLIAGGYSLSDQRLSSGLKSAEVFNPMTGHSCPVGDLPQPRYHAPICNNLFCGGLGSPGSERSCDKFDSIYSFRLPVTLVEKRYFHLCWGLKSGEVILLGGRDSQRTTEKVSADGSSSSASFSLPYDTQQSCGIDLGDYFVVTGGYNGISTVTQYSDTGFDKYLPNLKQGRRLHACSKFVDNDGRTALLVTGGIRYEEGKGLSSTEIYLKSKSSWSYAAALPSDRVGFSAATLDNSVFVFGGTPKDTKEILYYDSAADKWNPDSKMTEPKWSYGLGLVINVSYVCP